MIAPKLKPAIICAIVLVIAISFNSLAQKDSQTFTARNSVFLEIGGNAGQYAFNYGRIFHQKGGFKLNGSAGFSLWADPIEGSTIWNPAVPLEVSALFGKSKHHLEFGVGITPYLQNEVNSTFESGTLVQTRGANHLAAILPFRVGYRYQKPEGGFFFRVGYTPFFDLPNKSGGTLNFQPIHAGLGLGLSF
ncbi:hypothetical protein SYJ56_03010 [Algoriphagus sp. D3-2-R+10]|uniref:hypothetical protein n=1 Tax=Algoriphagus aurantiacus TaxID=3103948 RepID=UPI002B3B64DD|nr:hypothetical protein [Algoriphagus sp. D3-2-R+10]MEB2774256.1 hypothetical protein [Algoriphagus sp. D3-2-R+10]